MPSRIRSALVLPLIVGCQVGLTLGALALCDVRTGRGLLDLMVITSGNPDSWPQRWWDLYFYRGYPVPWAEYREDHLGVSPSWDGERTEPVVVARNWAVPACLIVLALGLPVLLAAEIARGGARVRGSPTSPRSRRRRAFWVVTPAAGGGLMAAFLDVGTDPESSPLWGVGNVPFDRPPGRWLRVPYSPGSTLLVDPPQVEWLRNKRRAWFPPERGDCRDPESLAREWAGRTRRTLVGVVLGAVCGCVLLRPWRRTGKPDADGTSGPPGEHPVTSGPTAL